MDRAIFWLATATVAFLVFLFVLFLAVAASVAGFLVLAVAVAVLFASLAVAVFVAAATTLAVVFLVLRLAASAGALHFDLGHLVDHVFVVFFCVQIGVHVVWNPAEFVGEREHGFLAVDGVADLWVVFVAVDRHIAGDVEQFRVSLLTTEAMQSYEVFDFVLDDCVEFFDAELVHKWFVVDALCAGWGESDTHRFCFFGYVLEFHGVFLPGHVHCDGAVEGFTDHQAASGFHQVVGCFAHRFLQVRLVGTKICGNWVDKLKWAGDGNEPIPSPFPHPGITHPMPLLAPASASWDGHRGSR